MSDWWVAMRVYSAVYLYLAVCVLPFAVISCSAGDAPTIPAAGAATPATAPIPVSVATVQQKPVPLELRAIGSVEPFSSVAVHAQITGQLTAVNFKEGDDVKEGQSLFVLDRRPLQAALQQAHAALDRDEAQAANAMSQAQRYQDLSTRGIATREQVETSMAAATALRATVDADRAAVENAGVQLEYATITAPLSGRTGALMVHEGNLVRANDTVPLVVINQISPIYVSFGVPEARLPAFKHHMERGSLVVRASPSTDDGPPSSGRITFVDNAIDQETGTIKMKGTFPNDDRRLWPGQFVNVVATLATDQHALVAPSTAVQAGQQGDFVFVVKPDKAIDLRLVVVDRTSGSDSVIERGLQAGETVVTDGQLRLVPGSRIIAKSDASQTEAP